MQAQGESLRKGFEEIVTLMHVKVKMLVQDAFDNPLFVFRYVLIVAAALSLYIILLETAQVCGEIDSHAVYRSYTSCIYHNTFELKIIIMYTVITVFLHTRRHSDHT
jgi:hypothetical protein